MVRKISYLLEERPITFRKPSEALNPEASCILCPLPCACWRSKQDLEQGVIISIGPEDALCSGSKNFYPLLENFGMPNNPDAPDPYIAPAVGLKKFVLKMVRDWFQEEIPTRPLV